MTDPILAGEQLQQSRHLIDPLLDAARDSLLAELLAAKSQDDILARHAAVQALDRVKGKIDEVIANGHVAKAKRDSA